MEVTAFAVANDGRHAVTGELDHSVTVWDIVTTPEALLRLPPQAGRVTAVAISAYGRHVAAGCVTGDVTVWDVATAEVRLRLHCAQGATALCLTPQGDRIVVGDDDSATVHVIADEHTGGDGESPAHGTVIGRLTTRGTVTALAANPAMPYDVMLGTTFGQVAYVRVP
jgi:WD40 repeat protein